MRLAAPALHHIAERIVAYPRYVKSHSAELMRTIDITADDLFGNLMAQHEDEEIFNSYVYEREDLKAFWDPKKRILIVSAIKGTGKSSLCRITKEKIKKAHPDHILLLKYDSEISPDLDTEDITEWVKSWKQNILQSVASELGRRIGFAWTDDAITLVEEARKGGYREHSLLGAILDRIRSSKLYVESPKRKISEDFLNRVTSKNNRVWLILDEVDQHFDSTTKQKSKLTAFFIACSELSLSIPEIIFRLTVRPNVWSILAASQASLSGLRQYIKKLSWDYDQIRKLLALRVQAYLKRTGQTIPETDIDQVDDQEWFLMQVFTGNFDLGSGSRSPGVVLATLSARRPRWLMELCKASATEAANQQHDSISYETVEAAMRSFGFDRMQDLASEYKAQSEQILEIITAFTGESPIYNESHNLLQFIRDPILTQVDIQISDRSGEVTAADVANLLYMIGFIHARKQEDDGSYIHLQYQDRQDLFKNEKRADDDSVFSWEIHPMFRNALFSKRETTPGSRKKRQKKGKIGKRGRKSRRRNGS